MVKYQDSIQNGLICCSIGDFCLAMENHPKFGHELWFLSGLVVFLIGHIIFMLAMRKRIYDVTLSKRIHNNNNWAFPVMAVLCSALLAILIPAVDDPVLKCGVVAYGLIIGSMTYHSLLMNTCYSNMFDFFINMQENQDPKSYKANYLKEMSRQTEPTVPGL